MVTNRPTEQRGSPDEQRVGPVGTVSQEGDVGHLSIRGRISSHVHVPKRDVGPSRSALKCVEGNHEAMRIGSRQLSRGSCQQPTVVYRSEHCVCRL